MTPTDAFIKATKRLITECDAAKPATVLEIDAGALLMWVRSLDQIWADEGREPDIEPLLEAAEGMEWRMVSGTGNYAKSRIPLAQLAEIMDAYYLYRQKDRAAS